MTVNGTPLRVVVADDEDDIRLVLSLQLGAVADVVVVGDARDGAQAVEQCLTLRPDAVVMDLLMPSVSGFEAIARLKEEAPEVGIVAYTGVAGEFVRDEMARLGVPLVLKSGDPEALVMALRAVAARA
jgi:DNA-binding NarL/FixJ family response regulator